MKSKIFLSFISCLLLLLVACKKDSISLEMMAASIDGQSFESDIATGMIDAQGRLIINSTTTDTLRPYFIFDIYQRDKGTYLFATPEVATAQYYPGFGLNELYYAVDGFIEITDHKPDDKRVKGTFNITFEESTTSAELLVEDGTFDIIYE